MKKKLIAFSIIFSVITVFALSNSFSLDTSTLSFAGDGKKDDVKSSFKKEYNLSYSAKEEDSEEKEELKKIAKRTTYLLFGDFNNTNETSEHFYNRRRELYAPLYKEWPDENSKEYNYASASGMAIPQVFAQVVEKDIKYNAFGNINVEINENLAVCIVDLPNIKIKVESETDPMKYVYERADLKMYYAYFKNGDEWQLWYLYGEYTDDVAEYINNTSTMESKQMAIAPADESILNNVYDFKKINELDKDIITRIYDDNKNNIVYINGIYNNYVVSTGNGFFISDGLLVTTWSFLQKSLVEAQYISIVNSEKTYIIDGIVTINPEADVAVLKVKGNESYVRLGDVKELKVEDPAIIISSKYGTGLVVQTGIITDNSDYLQTSIPLGESDGGSPLFNRYGEVVGINTSKTVNASVSNAMNANALKEVYDMFKNTSVDQIESISFEELKDKYFYLKMGNEKVINNIPDKEWKKYSKIGNIANTIQLELVKASYKKGAVSLRYKNEISSYLSSMKIAASFKKQLITDGYNEVLNSKTKSIYRNDKYQVVIMDEFDYLIVVMVEL